MERRGRPLLVGGVFDKIAGEQVAREFVVGQVAVQGPDQPIPPRPDVRSKGIGSIAGGIGIPGQIQPHPGPALPEMGRCQETIHKTLVGVGATIRHESSHLVGRGRQSGEVQGQPPDQGRSIGLCRGFEPGGLEPRRDETVDSVLHPTAIGHLGKFGTSGRAPGPMGGVLGPLLDPAGQDLRLGRRHRILQLRRRHDLLGVGGPDTMEDFAVLGVVGGDGRPRGAVPGRLDEGIEAEFPLPRRLIRSVAGIALGRQDRLDLCGEINAGLAPSQRGRAEDEERTDEERASFCRRDHGESVPPCALCEKSRPRPGGIPDDSRHRRQPSFHLREDRPRNHFAQRTLDRAATLFVFMVNSKPVRVA